MSAMTQQVSLLIDGLLPKRTLFGAVHAALSVGGFVAILLAISVHTLIDVSHLTGEHDRLTQQLAALAEANAKTRASVNSVEDPKLAERVADLKAQLQSRTALETALAGEVKTRSHGFSGHFDGLAANALRSLRLLGLAGELEAEGIAAVQGALRRPNGDVSLACYRGHRERADHDDGAEGQGSEEDR